MIEVAKIKGKTKVGVISSNNSEGESMARSEIIVSHRVEKGDGGREVGRVRISPFRRG